MNTSIIKPNSMAHFVFQTRKFEEMINWYKLTLGFDVRFEHPIMAFLSFDEEHHRIALINLSAIDKEEKNSFSSAKGTVEHIAFTFNSVSDLFQTYKRLKSVDITPYWCIHHGMTLSMYYGDPDGNQIEFQVEVYNSAEEANEFLATEVFMKNPIGVDFDPDALLAKHESGTPDAEILQYPIGGEMSRPRNAPNR